MRVYRCIRLQEVINKYKNKNNDVRKSPSNLNTHTYEEDEKYIHFFRYDAFAKYYFNLGKAGSYDRENDEFILYMTANIPKEILDKHFGFGFYTLNNKQTIMPEYAIPSSEFDSSFIVSMTEKPIGIDARKNETIEYSKYLELIDSLTSQELSLEETATHLLENNFDDLLGTYVDYRDETQIKEGTDALLDSLLDEMPPSDDMEIETL